MFVMLIKMISFFLAAGCKKNGEHDKEIFRYGFIKYFKVLILTIISDMDAIVRVELRGVQSALNSEVQSRLQLEQKLETIQMALKEAENNRRSDMDELVSQHEEAMRY